ncbi:MAG: archease [Deltaproteobacteria bacterium]|nr:archease [Deltaproteobacteria bacterium]
MEKPYRMIEHTADIGIQVTADTASALFSQVAWSMIDLMTEAEAINLTEEKRVTLEGEDYKDLMIRWLNEILFWFDTETFVPGRFTIEEIESRKLVAKLWGERFDRSRHGIGYDIKAATYHELRVEELEGGHWFAQVIFDV